MNLVLPPDLFILGGGICKKMDKFKKYITIKKPVVPAQTLNNAGIIGATLAAYENQHTCFTQLCFPAVFFV